MTDSFSGAIFGLILFIISIILIWWNESSNVKIAKTIALGKEICNEIENHTIDPKNNGKLVLISG